MNIPTLSVSKCCQSTHHTSIDQLSRVRLPQLTTDTAFEAVIKMITMTITAEAATKSQSEDLPSQKSVTVTTAKYLRVKASVRELWPQPEKQSASMRIVTISRCARVLKSTKRRPKVVEMCSKTEANKTGKANPQNLRSQTQLINSLDSLLVKTNNTWWSSHPDC